MTRSRKILDRDKSLCKAPYERCHRVRPIVFCCFAIRRPRQTRQISWVRNSGLPRMWSESIRSEVTISYSIWGTIDRVRSQVMEKASVLLSPSQPGLPSIAVMCKRRRCSRTPCERAPGFRRQRLADVFRQTHLEKRVDPCRNLRVSEQPSFENEVLGQMTARVTAAAQ